MKPEEAIGIFEAVKGLYKSPLLIEAMNTATKAIKELRKYQEIGTVEELKEIKNSLSLYKRYVDYLKKERDEVIEEVQQYREIGTLEECRKAVERQKPKEPTVLKQQHSDFYNCPKCGRNLILKCGTDWFGGQHYKSCPNCGQAIRWNENLEGMEDE